MTITEISQLPLGTKVYKIWNGEIRPYITLAFDAKDKNYFYLISGSNHTDAVGYYLPSSGGIWECDYDKAKEIMWEQITQRIKSINRIYFDGNKSEDFTIEN